MFKEILSPCLFEIKRARPSGRAEAQAGSLAIFPRGLNNNCQNNINKYKNDIKYKDNS